MNVHSLQVLLVEGDEDDALRIRQHLSEVPLNGGTTLDHAPSVAEAALKLDTRRYDTLLIADRLGADGGLSFLRRVRAKGIDTPAILLASKGCLELAAEAAKAGAVDCLEKSTLAPGPLGAAVRYAIELHRSEALRARAEDALRESEARYRRVFDQALTGNYITTPGGRILACNAAFARILGFDSVEDALAARAYSLYPDVEAREHLLDRLRESGQLEHVEAELRRRDGTAIQVLENVVAVRDASGRITELRGSILDITERKRAEKDLAESSRFNAEIIASVHEVIFACDRDLRYVLWNRLAEESSGIPAKDVIGRRVRDVFPDLNVVEPLLHRALAGEPVSTPDLPVRRPGTDRITWTAGTLAPRRNAEGAVVGVIGAIHDITERKRSEETLQKLTRAVEQSPTLIMITDATGRIEYVNPKFTETTGFTPAEAIGQNARILKSGRTPEEVYREMWETILSGRKWSGEILNRTKDGELRWFSARISPLRGTDGLVTHFVAVLEDVQERRSLEEQLRQSQKMEAVGSLAGGLAHDFNNLLGVIMGHAGLLLRGAEPDHPGTRRVEQIQMAAESAARLTRQLLAFSRKQVLDPKVVSLNAIVGNVEKMLRRLIGEDVETTVALDPQLGLVKADPGQIEQVLMNLAVNARDAMPQGGRLVIETVNQEIDRAYALAHAGVRPGPHVMVAVSDTGLGMDAETRSRVFEPFFTTKEPGKGTGLGLSTVYGIVQQSGGHVTVYSEPGMGSTFKVYLPRVEEDATPVQADDAGGEPVPAGTGTILLVEDHAGLRALIGETLRGAGYTVLEAASPAEALAAMEGDPTPVHLLLTDVVMPGMNGRELARRLAATRGGLKVLFISGYTDDAIVQHGVLEPGIAFLAKPFTAAALARKVHTVFEAAAGVAPTRPGDSR